MRQARWIGPAVALALTAAVLPATARTRDADPATAPAPVTATGCEEHEAWVDGDAAAVAAVLPKRYTAFTDANGAPLVFARAMRCDAAASAGRPAPVVMADWGVVIDSPDGAGCGSGTPGVGPVEGQAPPICNWYMLGFVSDDQRMVDWLHQQTPSVPAEHVPGLTYRMGQADATGSAPFHFAAPGFTIDDVSSFGPSGLSLRGGYWLDTPQGTAQVRGAT